MKQMTNEELIDLVNQLQEVDEDVYHILERYYDRYDMIPGIQDVANQAGLASEFEAFQSEMRLVAAGCIFPDMTDLRTIPVLSPTDARNWCGTEYYSREACELKLDLMIIEYSYRHDGARPTIDELLEKYKRSSLYPVIEERAVKYICDSYVLTEQIPPHVKFADGHKEKIRQALKSMGEGLALPAV